jgi:cytochrome c peroxidase
MNRTGITLAAVFLVVWALPCLADDSLTAKEELGKFLFFDKISEPGSMACADCHSPMTGFTGPNPGINLHGAVYRGAVPKRFGNRRPPSAAYATLSPVFHFDTSEALFLGGNFWDGRATGDNLGNPAADQALGPFLNPVEQNNPSKQVVLEKVAASHYAYLWEEVWGAPIAYGTQMEIDTNYGRIGLAIKEYEASSEVNQFSSKFDTFWNNVRMVGMDVTAIDMSNWQDFSNLGLDEKELEGLALFNDESKGKCSLCHVLDPAVDEYGNELPPAFTDFSFDNLGVPRNPDNPFYDMDEVYLDDGSPINPAGESWIDPGLGGFLEHHSNPAWQAMAAENWGKHKVPTLRNAVKGPGIAFPKAFMHNGVFKSMKEVVHFYNTRDVETWPPPEVAANVNTDELGDLGLTGAEEDLIVVFLRTLSDGAADKSLGSDTAVVLPSVWVSPNPSRGATGIRYVLPTSGAVQVQVFDVTGRRVATLVDGFQGSGGHTVPFALNGRASGVYFVRLDTTAGSTTTKLVSLE